MKTLEGEEIPRRKYVALYATMTSRNQINQPWKSDPYQVLVLAYITPPNKCYLYLHIAADTETLHAIASISSCERRIDLCSAYELK